MAAANNGRRSGFSVIGLSLVLILASLLIFFLFSSNLDSLYLLNNGHTDAKFISPEHLSSAISSDLSTRIHQISSPTAFASNARSSPERGEPKPAIMLKSEKHGISEDALNAFKTDHQSGIQPSWDTITRPIVDPQNNTVYWNFIDSQGMSHNWGITLDEYEGGMRTTENENIKYLKMENGSTVAVRDYTSYLHPQIFSQLADDIYESTGRDDAKFIHEVWFLVAQSTEYSKENSKAGEMVQSPLQTLFESKGDCEDLTILAASIIMASSHAEHWDIKLVYFDASDPLHPSKVNHVALYVDTGKFTTFVESTSKSNGLGIWGQVQGWYIDL